MPSLRQIRRRIRSVQNTAKVTKAMEMVAASKMRRAQQAVLAARPYAERLETLLTNLAAQERSENAPPLLQSRPVERIQVIHITPDRGLCGGLPSNINRATGQFILENEHPASIVTVGKKGRDFMVRASRDVLASFIEIGDRPKVEDILPISHLIIQSYTEGAVDQVFLAYSRFVNATLQQPVIRQLLPVQPAELAPHEQVGYIYEPSSRVVLEALLPRYVEMLVYHAVLENNASEQSARMVAMRNATDSAKDMMDELTLHMNKVRQEMITNELLDLVGGAAALEQ
ncbi:MAG: F-type H+-transporting ATPase subunit gamma [Chloroflexi bacterium]|jgi:F-type H+-transporting ATPase subunit gamma|nr:MAG: F-type H+-transporting ATPase subunit gamma [Chloroflexota bacterium]